MSYRFFYLLLIFNIGSADAGFIPILHLMLEDGDPYSLEFQVVGTENCEVDYKKINEIVEGVFIRSRLNIPNSEKKAGKIVLVVSLQCGSYQSLLLYDLDVYFGKYLGSPPMLVAYPGAYYNYNFQKFGLNDEDGIKSLVKDLVEKAVTEYIKATTK